MINLQVVLRLLAARTAVSIAEASLNETTQTNRLLGSQKADADKKVVELESVLMQAEETYSIQLADLTRKLGQFA